MDEALKIGRPLVVANDFAVQRELHDVARLDQFRAARARQQKSVRSGRVTDTDMAVSIDNLLVRQNAVRDDEIID
jgi:hypothetical protein